MTLYSVKDAAVILRVTDARVRQLCIKHNLGTIIGSSRVLSDAEIKILKATPRRDNGESPEDSQNDG